MKTALAIASLALVGCGTIPLPGGGTVTGTPGWYKTSTQLDPEASFGVLVTARAAVPVADK